MKDATVIVRELGGKDGRMRYGVILWCWEFVANIKEIARQAECSPTTVRFVLSDPLRSYAAAIRAARRGK